MLKRWRSLGAAMVMASAALLTTSVDVYAMGKTVEVRVTHGCLGIVLHPSTKHHTNCPDANLSGVLTWHRSTSASGMPYIDLAHADLVAVSLPYANLTGANLAGADLAGANVDHAILMLADLSGADVSDTDFSGSDVQLVWHCRC